MFIQVNGTNTVSRPILQILENSRKEILQNLMLQISRIMIFGCGFPCQPFSIAGVSKKNSMGKATGFEDKTQGTLFFDVCRNIERKKAKSIYA